MPNPDAVGLRGDANPEPPALVHGGCSYFAFANSVCTKCGQFVIEGPWPNVKRDAGAGRGFDPTSTQ